ncbi:MAG: hypothetical protein KBG11_02650 [Bacteroidia bacterium]|nr:hypothetical protein [Bacteroidia bacterium]
MNKLILLINCIALSVITFAQPLLVANDNVIYQPKPIEIDSQNRVFKIVHIGDSHIQADWFSGKLRNLLQAQYGDAGTGLLFPYKQIKTNGPNTFSSVAGVPLTASKIVKCRSACNVGIAAYDAHVPAGTTLVFNIKKDTLLQYVSVLFQSTDSSAINIDNDLDENNYVIQNANSFFISSYKNQVTNSIKLNTKNNITLNGIIASNGNPGVLYYTIGANGATFNNYYNSGLFFEQLKALQPDLVIVSLGTNESVSDMPNDTFNLQLQNFNTKLKEVTGQAAIMYTTPADNYLRRVVTTRKKVKGKWRTRKVVAHINNPKVEPIRQSIINLCYKDNLMCWDLYRAMGGDRSMRQWVNSGYTAKDHIHFSKGGYEVQGQLLFDAFKKYVLIK